MSSPQSRSSAGLRFWAVTQNPLESLARGEKTNPFCSRSGYRRESFIHESTDFLLTTPLCCNAVNSLNQPRFQRGKGPGSGFIRLWIVSEREEPAERGCAAIPRHGRAAMCSANSTAPIVSQIIPTRHGQPVAFSSYTAGLAGPGRRRNAGPQQLGKLRGGERGEEGSASLVSIHPQG